MKSKKIFLIIFCVFAAFFSCKSSPAAQKENEYRLRNFNREIRLFPSQSTESARMNFELELLEVIGSGKGMKFFNGFLYSGRSPKQYTGELFRHYEELYLEHRKLAESRNPLPAVLNWEYIEHMNFFMLKERGMQIEREKYVYSGGAYGMRIKKYYVLDLAGQKVLALEDFFRGINGQRLKGIVIKELRRYSAEKGFPIEEGMPLSQGLFLTDDPCISRNFFVNNEGLGLCWNPVEIAPYAAGSIEIVLPWKLIRPLLRHDAMELLEKFGYYQFM
jgi:hypothetical protein